MEEKEAVAALSALAQVTRLAVFRVLVQAGPEGATVGRIGDLLQVPPPTLSFHLKELVHAGLVENRQEGRFVRCSANFERMNALLAFLTENCCQESGASCGTARCEPESVPRSRRRTHEALPRPSRRR